MDRRCVYRALAVPGTFDARWGLFLGLICRRWRPPCLFNPCPPWVRAPLNGPLTMVKVSPPSPRLVGTIRATDRHHWPLFRGETLCRHVSLRFYLSRVHACFLYYVWHVSVGDLLASIARSFFGKFWPVLQVEAMLTAAMIIYTVDY